MKRYRFSLEAVLRLRRMEEEQAREALQLENSKLRELVIARDHESDRYKALSLRPLATSATDLEAERLAHELVAESVSQAERAVIEQATRTAHAQLAFRSAEQRVEALLRLEVRQRAAHELEVQRADGLVLDDLVTAQFVRAQAEDQRRGTHV